MYGVSRNEDRDIELREYKAHKHNKLFPEDPNISNILNVVLRRSTLVGCDLFSEDSSREYGLPGHHEKCKLHGRKSFLTTQGRNK
jgi:hypothetical protein